MKQIHVEHQKDILCCKRVAERPALSWLAGIIKIYAITADTGDLFSSDVLSIRVCHLRGAVALTAHRCI